MREALRRYAFRSGALRRLHEACEPGACAPMASAFSVAREARSSVAVLASIRTTTPIIAVVAMKRPAGRVCVEEVVRCLRTASASVVHRVSI